MVPGGGRYTSQKARSWVSLVNVIKLFFSFITDYRTKYTRLFVPGKFVKDSLIFAKKALSHIHNTSFSEQLMNGPKRLECFFPVNAFQSSVMKHSSFLGLFVSYKENKVS